MAYFDKFPTVIYRRPSNVVLPNGSKQVFDIEATNILTRYRIKETIINNQALFYPYQWREGDRPDTVAEDYYGSADYFWLVYYSNKAFDFEYTFPLDPNTFTLFLITKYKEPTLAANSMTESQWNMLTPLEKQKLVIDYTQTTIHSYRFYFEDKPDLKYESDTMTFNYYTGAGYQAERAQQALQGNLLPACFGEVPNIYTYEDEVNNAKREVQLLDNEFLQQVIQEFNRDLAKNVSEKALIGDI